VGPVGMYIRRKVDETPEFLQTKHTRTPIREVFATEKEALLLGAGLVAVGTAGTYFALYLPTYATARLHLSPAVGYFATMVLAALGIVLCPVAGHLADRVGLTRMMLPAAILMLLSFYPVFLLITVHPGLTTLLVGLIWETLLQIAYVSASPAVMASIFPARTRVTGLSFSYNLGVTLFGGFAPAIFTWLTAITHNNTAPSFYLTAMALVSIVAIVMVNRRHPHMLVRSN
jgi:MHS family proline/betaine transporter-like MFS transporter